MIIQFPTSRGLRDMPPEKEIRRILQALVARCSIDERFVHLMVIGGRYEHQFKIEGVKLLSLSNSDRFSVPILIGCKPSNVQGHLSYKENGSAIASSRLYEMLRSSFGGKVMIIEPVSSTAKSNGNHASSTQAPSDVVESEVVTVADAEKPIDQEEESPVAVLSNLGPAPSGNSAASAPIRENYKGFFKDIAKVHTATTALLAGFGVDQLFGFNDFARIMEQDMGIKCPAQNMAAMIHVFTSRGLMVRRNKISPTRYSMTKEAETFAALSVNSPKVDIPVKKSEPAHVIVEPAKVSDIGVSNTDRLMDLRKLEDEFQGIFDEIEKLETTLDQNPSTELDSEVTGLNAEVSSLEKRLRVIRGRLSEIEKIQGGKAEKTAKLAELRRKVADPRLVKAHKEFTELRAMFLRES